MMTGYKLLGRGVCDLLWCTLLEDDEGEDGGDCFFHKLAQCAEAELLQCRVSNDTNMYHYKCVLTLFHMPIFFI